MSLEIAQQAVHHLVLAGTVATLAGLVFRHRAHLCWTFVLYLVALVLGEGALALWRDQLFHYWYFIGKQGVYDAIKVGIAVEVARRVLEAFPGARAGAARLLLAVLTLSALAIWFAPVLAHRHADVYLVWQPRVNAAGVWIFAVSAIVALWYRLPIHAWYRGLLVGFCGYGLLFSGMLGALQRYGLAGYGVVGVIDGCAYLAAMIWWAFSAWRPYAVPHAYPVAARRLRLEGV